MYNVEEKNEREVHATKKLNNELQMEQHKLYQMYRVLKLQRIHAIFIPWRKLNVSHGLVDIRSSSEEMMFLLIPTSNVYVQRRWVIIFFMSYYLEHPSASLDLQLIYSSELGVVGFLCDGVDPARNK